MSLETFSGINPEVPQGEETDKIESTPDAQVEADETKDIPKSYWKRHIGMLVLSLLLTYVPEKAEAGIETGTVAESAEEDQDVLKQRKEAYEKMKALVDGENLDEKVAELKKLFGPAVEEFLQISRIERDLDIFKNLDESPAKNQDGIWVNPSGAHFSTIGSIVNDAYHDRWEKKTIEPKPIEYINIDAVPGLTEERMQEFLRKVYPDKYLEKSVSKIEFVNQSEIKDNWQILGQVRPKSVYTMSTSGPVNDPRVPIKINLGVQGITEESFLETLRHEIGHTVQWNTSLELTSAEKIQMILEVHDRVKASDRYMSPYVERISVDDIKLFASTAQQYKDDEKVKIVAYIKSNEYWAEIHREYFKDKAGFKKSHPTDYELVKKWTKDSGE
jgi:hypothetical protein